MHLSAHPSLSIPTLGAFQLQLRPFNSTGRALLREMKREREEAKKATATATATATAATADGDGVK